MAGSSKARFDTGKLLEVVDHLYASILDDAALPTALRSLAGFAGAKGTFWVTADRASGKVLQSLGVGTDPAVQLEYDQYYGARDVRIPPSLSTPLGQPITENSHLERQAFERSEIYREFLVPHDVPHILAVWVARTPTVLSAVSLQRSRHQGAFSTADAARLAPLMPHLLRALSVRRLVEPIRQRQQVYLDLLDRLPFGIVFLDESGRIMEVSAPAEEVLRTATGLAVDHGHLSARFAADDGPLQRGILATSSRRSPDGGETVIVNRIDGKRPLTVAVVPIRESCMFMSSPPACMVVIYDPESRPAPAVQSVARSLHLTPAEAMLACVLFTGVTLKEAAAQLGVSANTCKTQLKSIYGKTGCQSHVDLARTVFMTGLTQPR